MKKMALLICFVLFSLPANAEMFYVRDDGGTPIVNNIGQCDGKSDKPKSADRHCAFNTKIFNVSGSTNLQDIASVTSGNYTVEFKPAILWVPMERFNSNPLYYTSLINSGRRVGISNYGGMWYEIILK